MPAVISSNLEEPHSADHPNPWLSIYSQASSVSKGTLLHLQPEDMSQHGDKGPIYKGANEVNLPSD
jgi:hypothetical protein